MPTDELVRFWRSFKGQGHHWFKYVVAEMLGSERRSPSSSFILCACGFVFIEIGCYLTF